MKLHSFKNLLLEELRDIYDAEQQLVKAMPPMIDAAVLPELKQALVQHLEETEVHLQRLQTIFKGLNEDPAGNPCRTMQGLIAEWQDLLNEERKADPGVFEAALIGSAQKVEHWEIAAYGCARTYAQMLGLEELAEWLQKTLHEESKTNQKLNDIAIQSVNPEAAEATMESKHLREAVMAVLEVTH